MAETLTPDHVKALQRFAPDATSEMIAGGTAVFGGGVYPANHIVGMGLYGPVTGADIDRVEEFYRSRGVPCEIVVSPLADRSLLELLAPRGYRITEFNSVLIRRLHRGRPDRTRRRDHRRTGKRSHRAALGPGNRKGICRIRPAARQSFCGLCFGARQSVLSCAGGWTARRGSGWRHHAGGWHRGPVRQRDAPRVSAPRCADSAD